MNTSKPLSKQPQATSPIGGFSLVEMLIVAPIVILMIGIFVSAIVAMTGDILSTRSANSLSYNVQFALDTIATDVKLSGGFLATNNIALSSPQGYNNDTTNFHNADATNGTMLILNTYATTSNPLDSTQNLFYMSGQPNACNSAQLSQNPPVMFNVVYFVRNNTLWRRVIAPANYTTVGCAGGSIGSPWQQPSCATISGFMCKALDQRLVDGIETGGFSVNYYTTNTSTTPNTIASDNSKSDAVRFAALQTTSTVSVTINASVTAAGRVTTQSGTIREVSPNNNTTVTSDVTWSSFSMQSGWTDYGSGYNPNGYRRTKDGVVTLRGLIRKSSAMSGGEIIATLPVGYRPAEQLIFQTSTSPNAASRVDVYTNGNIAAWGDPNWLSLEGINFLASDTPYAFTNLGMLNGWVAYGAPFSPAAYAVDASGRTHVKGLVKNGTTTSGTPIATLPAGTRPAEYYHLGNDNNNVFGFTSLDSSGNIIVKSGLNGYLSLQSMTYPASYTGWVSLTLQNGWLYYGSPFTTPQYTKSADGLVSLKGLINTGTVGATVATLPVGYRPTGRVLYGNVSYGLYSRVDIDSSGNIIAVAGNNGWFSLDNISFFAGQ